MKKFYKLIIFLFLCLTVIPIFNITNKNNITYLSLGDGLSLGINPFNQIDYGYSDYLKAELEKNNLLDHYIKSFSSKDKSIYSLKNDLLINKKIKIEKNELNIRQSLREADLLTISIGINDLLYKLSLIEELSNYELTRIINEIELDFNDLIKEIKKYYKYNIYIIGYYNINSNNIYLLEGIRRLNKIFQNNSDVIYINTYNNFSSKYLTNPHSFYPNSDGYYAIYSKLREKVIKNLKNNKTIDILITQLNYYD